MEPLIRAAAFGLAIWPAGCAQPYRIEEDLPYCSEGAPPIIDDLAPLYHVRADVPPLLLKTGERELEMLDPYEENAYMMRMMLVSGHEHTRLFELDSYEHAPKESAYPLILKEAARILETMENYRRKIIEI
ncbi:MAG: hypothetical protein VYC82_08530 [Verrucomicrobiota bacterium]|nr:hypothetical protein [Verrucomicrobiota bacterium]